MSKYNAVKTTIDGITFASKAEARRYQDLKLLVSAGEVTNLELQPKYPLIVKGIKIGTYIADFKYFYGGLEYVEDVKGVKTPVYRLKKKLVKALYGIEIYETQ